MVLAKRYCVEYVDGTRECFREDGFWYSDKGTILKWVILACIFLFFMIWFVGGYIHAKQRLKKGLPLLFYHRFLVSYSERRRYGQAGVPQNHFTFYQTQPQPYASHQNGPYQQRHDGAWSEPPPLYQNNDAPPQYFAPPGATKVNGNQRTEGAGMEMPHYGAPQGAQQSGIVGASQPVNGDVEAQNQPQLPPRPQAAKAKIMGFVERFKK